jgi:hypothetical protein
MGAALHRVLPWVLALGVLVAGLLATDTPAADIARYGGYWLFALLVPGTLVHRALRGSRGNLPEDVGYGAVTGLVLELAAWALAAAIGRQHLLWAWPIPVVAAFVAVPRLRRHWRIRERRPLPLRWSWGIAGVMVLVVAWATAQWSALPLPPVTHTYYVDLFYHLALVHELTRTMPFEVPQMAGEALRYHYLSHAHMATASMISGVAPTTVLLRLWLVPIVLAAALVIAALARDLSGRWWAGPLAALAAFFAYPLMLGSLPAPAGSSISLNSPSATYLVPLLAVLTALCCDLVRGRRLGGGWALLPALAVACAGAKASGLPILAAGLLLATLALLVTTRRVAWSVVVGLGVVLSGMLVGYRLFAGGGAGTLSLQLLSIVRRFPLYELIAAPDDYLHAGGVIPPALVGAGAGTWLTMFVVVGWWVALQLPRFGGLVALGRRGTRADPAAWLLAGAVLAGAGGMWTLYHPSVGQLYFMIAAIPLAAVLLVWALADATPPHRAGAVLGAGLVGGAAAGYLLTRWYTPPDPGQSFGGQLLALTAPVLVAAAVAAAAAIGWWVARIRISALRGRGLAALFSALLGASLTAAWLTLWPGIQQAVQDGFSSPPTSDAESVTAEEMRAAMWLDAHAPDADVVATNVHCLPIATREHCNSRAFWVAGLGGRRTVIESWGYLDEVVAAHGVDGYSYSRQPPPDQERFALNERVFSSPTAADITKLRERYGARWLFADSRAGPVSPRLASFGVISYVDGPVTVYRLSAG